MRADIERSLYRMADEFLSDVRSRNPRGLDLDSALKEFKHLAAKTGTPKEQIEELAGRIIPEPEVPEFIRPGVVLQSCLTLLLAQPLSRQGHSNEIADRLVYKFLSEHEQELTEKHGFWP